MNVETIMMERILHILKWFWTSIRKTRARVLARMYASYKIKSPSVQMGNCRVYYETYCLPIQDMCHDLGIRIPDMPPRQPTLLVRWYLRLRFGWPWPVQLISYDGKRQDDVARTPVEMARNLQRIWDRAVKQAVKKEGEIKTMREGTPTISEETKQSQRVSPPRIHEPDIRRNEPGTCEMAFTEVAGVIIDNSF